MKNIKSYFSLFTVFICLASCKKNNTETVLDPVVSEKTAVYKDSVSFIINEKQYIFNDKYKAGVGNHAINIKPSSTIIKGGKLAYETGGYYWYGEQDSTLYSVFYGLKTELPGNHFEISFTKKLKDSQLQLDHPVLAPKDHTGIFKLGNLPFAVDLGKENTMDGISIDLSLSTVNEKLGTSIPGFSILVRSGLTKNIQNNSSFEITKVEDLKDGLYLVEAKFEVNLFDSNEKLYRLKNGFLRIKTSMTKPYVKTF